MNAKNTGDNAIGMRHTPDRPSLYRYVCNTLPDRFRQSNDLLEGMPYTGIRSLFCNFNNKTNLAV